MLVNYLRCESKPGAYVVARDKQHGIYANFAQQIFRKPIWWNTYKIQHNLLLKNGMGWILDKRNVIYCFEDTDDGRGFTLY